MSGQVFTIGEISKLLEVSPRTAARWFDKGWLAGYRHPGPRQDRRVPRAELERFIEVHRMPYKLPPEDLDTPN
jgi:excisionase family DNA binding protein